MSTSRDVLQLKTDAELRFFVENPGYYQAELVAAARHELRRRGPGALAPPVASTATPVAAATEPTPVLVTPAAPILPAPGIYTPVVEEAPARHPWLLLGSIAAVLLVAGMGFWYRTPSPQVVAAPEASSKPTHASSPDSLQLETAVASPLPTFDTEHFVEQALALVPAAERNNEQRAAQYRAISRRFWAAQNPSAHLLRQVQQGQPNPTLLPQTILVLSLWHDFDRTQVYSYTFEPGMADHLARMKAIARYQREALGELANNCAAKRPPRLVDERTLAHQQEIPHLLAPLASKTGPATVQL
jgi:hypothetical protein